MKPRRRRPSLDEVRTAFQTAAAAPGPACPEARVLSDAARGRLPAEAVRPLVDHLAGCPACADAWRQARGAE